MTAIVGVLNSQGIALAADSAVTVTGRNGKKVYNRSNKIFTLSKYHPIGIAIYNNADFIGIPLETIIKLYRKTIKEKSFNTVNEYKNDFLDFVRSQVRLISPESKRDAFYSFCQEAFNHVKDSITTKLKAIENELLQLDQAEAIQLIDIEMLNEIDAYLQILQGYHKADYVNLPAESYYTHYQNELTEIANFIEQGIQKHQPLAVLKPNHLERLNAIFFELVNIEFIFERFCGLIFFGFGEAELFPSSHLALLGTLIVDQPRIRIFEARDIVPGKTNSNILPYVQGDVTEAVLTGVDPNFKNEMSSAVESSFRTISEEITNRIPPGEEANQIAAIINDTGTQLLQKLNEYQMNNITGPLLDILAHMGKEDMAELAESLVNITSLKRKFTSSDSADESVGGPVDVALVTKGDGFVWMKRKQYFDINDNRGFIERYYKS
ncbi:hypothetical protein [Dinghuibacter silviterrae]|uniref:Uncharacterized protein n=1 Tax=Dinghuibacter silviterrae TaxID=1539049 RepID=A0A4R8DW63_9BACT|nr:hypothetical protein [Dinghuibacter silviterrae]TDX02178.1 hypothetical protein EDB95_3229 [Dinghuibacter silviterrae]